MTGTRAGLALLAAAELVTPIDLDLGGLPVLVAAIVGGSGVLGGVVIAWFSVRRTRARHE